MANWKKVIVSGSHAHLNTITGSSLTNNNLLVAGDIGQVESSGITFAGSTVDLGASSIISTGTGTILSGSFSGSFEGVADFHDLTDGDGIIDFTYDGSAVATVKLDTGSVMFVQGVRTNISATDTGGASGIDFTYNSSTGDISAVVATASISITGDTGTPDTINLGETASFVGTANEIETAVSANQIQIGLPNAVTIVDLTVSDDLIVMGTASFQHTTNLDVADRFIRLASGSSGAGDGGIVVQQSVNKLGEAIGFDSATVRWGFSGSFDASQATLIPDAYVAAAFNGSTEDPFTETPARYDKSGNLFTSPAGEIFIYA